MKDRITKRFQKDRPMVQISIRMPEDVIDDLKMVAEVLGFSGYQPLVRFYIGQCLRKDIEKVESARAPELISALKKRGLSESQIREVLIESHTIPA
ncbi:MAG: hypothetical protein D0530_01845 [Methylococcales bacterium]|nr:MAG: hypothetical protein D0530_01845 [Methylococcales bacterium]